MRRCMVPVMLLMCLRMLPAQAVTTADTVRTVAPAVIFLVPAPADAESLSARSVFRYDSLLHRFLQVRDRLAPFLRKNGIALHTAAAAWCGEQGDSVASSSRGSNGPFSVLFVRTGAPSCLLPGIRPDSEIFSAMMRYFALRR